MFRGIKEYKLPVAAVASTPLALPTPEGVYDRGDIQYRVRPSGCDVIYAFSPGDVMADATVVNGARPDGQISIADGAIELFKCKSGHGYISVISEDGVSSGFLIVTLGVGEVA